MMPYTYDDLRVIRLECERILDETLPVTGMLLGNGQLATQPDDPLGIASYDRVGQVIWLSMAFASGATNGGMLSWIERTEAQYINRTLCALHAIESIEYYWIVKQFQICCEMHGLEVRYPMLSGELPACVAYVCDRLEHDITAYMQYPDTSLYTALLKWCCRPENNRWNASMPSPQICEEPANPYKGRMF